MNEETKTSTLLLEMPHDPTKKEFIDEIKSAIREGKQVNMLTSSPDRSVPFSFGVIMSTLSFDETLKIGVSVSKQELTNPLSPWKLTVSPAVSENK